LPDRSTVAPVTLDSDITTLSILSGDVFVWPVYLSTENLSKAKRRSFNWNGLILIGHLPRCPNGPKNHNLQIAYKESMVTILRPLEEPAKSRIKVLCADSRTCHAYPQIASLLTDYSEQCNMPGIKYCWCLRCKIDPEDM
ncbi:hypothetical protein K440DRAFT_510262, partial [Wilcoxina mikolae CBS 423.85]